MPKEQVTLIPGTPETKTPERSGPPRLSLALDQDTYDALEKWANEDERSVSLYTTRLLRVYVAEKRQLTKLEHEKAVGMGPEVVGTHWPSPTRALIEDALEAARH